MAKKLSIAIISDLHCHPKRTKEEGVDHTYLLTDKLRTPENDHPVESLLKDVIKTEKPITVDLTLCPGDFTDKANKQGFISGWNFSLEINRELKSKEIIATLGNHDVDVYNNHSNYSLHIAQGIKKGFPIIDEMTRDVFWSKGGVFVERNDYRVLVINSAHFHHNKPSSTYGKVGDDLLEYIKKYLKDKKDDKINIAMSHHHPIDHSELKLGEEDKILNGNALLDILGEYKFDIFIHGHKHHALLRYHTTTKTNYRLPILAAGSFSSTSNLMFTSVRNYFHIINLTKNQKTFGEIRTWTFFPNSGWKSNLDKSGFPPFSGFGSEKTVPQIFNEIKKLFKTKGQLDWDFVTTKIEDIKHLIPSDANELYELLKKNKYHLDADICNSPKEIYDTNKLPKK